MEFNKNLINYELTTNCDPYTLGILCGTLVGRHLFLPNTIGELASLLKYILLTYTIKLEDEDWYLFTIGVLKALELYGFNKEYSLDWINLEEEEIPNETKAILETKINNKKCHLCVTFFKKD